MAKQKFMTKEQFEDRYEVIKKNRDNGKVAVFVKSRFTGTILHTFLGDADKVMDEVYFQLNVVNYKNANR